MLKRFIYILVPIALIFNGCTAQSGDALKIVIRTNGDCANILTMNKSGEVELLKGFGNPYKEDFTGINKIVDKSLFSIKKTEDVNYINSVVDSLSKEKLFKSGFLNDAPHYELFVGKEKKIDVYGTKSHILHKILMTISNNLPHKIDYYCQGKRNE